MKDTKDTKDTKKSQSVYLGVRGVLVTDRDLRTIDNR